MVDGETIKIIQRFMRRLQRENVKVDKIILYGSRITGKAHKYSDIDIAVISSDFGKDRFAEGVKLRNIASAVDPRMDTVPISLKSYEKDTWVPLIYEIKTKGVELPI